MTQSVLRWCVFAALAVVGPVTCAAAQQPDGRAAAAWLEALQAEVQAAAATGVVPTAIPCSPDCDALDGTSCSVVGATTKCYVPLTGGGCQSFNCRCVGNLPGDYHWACP